ncbi:RimK family protein [Rhodohalobacter sp.]|uniref:RimK family protein n=1 Tax=Rhodohalobacter sp. TaxID=1974210 RepID=UPI002ACEFAF7|nr:RimK family protein [Rhodohalobacter sp.]MDZ7755678.1 RimK family protein [Rhodohalobacter sp.]
MRQLIIVDNPKSWDFEIPGVDVIPAKIYLMDEAYSKLKRAKVYNLCKSYRYQSTGYYVSLLAAARGHTPIPNILTIQDLKSQTIIRFVSEELQKLVQKSFSGIQSESFILSIYFGKNLAKRYDKLASQLFNQFQAPFLRAEFLKKDGEWTLRTIHPISSSDIPEGHRDFVTTVAQEYFKKRNRSISKKQYIYDLAILVNPKEEFPPSDDRAIQRFIKSAESMGFYTELITREDYSRLNEFDALFIRETTGVNHHTYRFARRAMAEGLVVIDDPESILKCTNKVYLAELLSRHKIPAPETLIISSENAQAAAEKLGFPCILKQPDSSFSQGVVKADNQESYVQLTKQLLQRSDLLIAQSFIPTEFDWRIGILNNKPIYACQYHMARKHWQIYKRTGDGKTHAGNSDTIPFNEVPKNILDIALQAANLIGNGLYGVDLKEHNGQVYVIEINDNPSIDSGFEDTLLKDQLYDLIMSDILRRIEERKGVRSK